MKLSALRHYRRAAVAIAVGIAIGVGLLSVSLEGAEDPQGGRPHQPRGGEVVSPAPAPMSDVEKRSRDVAYLEERYPGHRDLEAADQQRYADQQLQTHRHRSILGAIAAWSGWTLAPPLASLVVALLAFRVNRASLKLTRDTFIMGNRAWIDIDASFPDEIALIAAGSNIEVYVNVTLRNTGKVPAQDLHFATEAFASGSNAVNRTDEAVTEQFFGGGRSAGVLFPGQETTILDKAVIRDVPHLRLVDDRPEYLSIDLLVYARYVPFRAEEFLGGRTVRRFLVTKKGLSIEPIDLPMAGTQLSMTQEFGIAI